MRKRKVASILFTGATAAAATGLNVPSAVAQAPHWTIDPGGEYVAHRATDAVMHNVSNSASLVCPVSAGTGIASGSLSGNSRSGIPAQLGTVSEAPVVDSASPCTGPFGHTFALHGAGNPWTISVSSYDLVAGVTRGKITNITTIVTGANNNCDFVVSGSVAFSYDNDNHSAFIDPRGGALHAKSVTGACFGVVISGTRMAYSARYDVSPAQTIIGNAS